jgi:hypothetical protein
MDYTLPDIDSNTRERLNFRIPHINNSTTGQGIINLGLIMIMKRIMDTRGQHKGTYRHLSAIPVFKIK